MKRAELLAPAGNYEGFLGAIHAGADAVYLGGSRFGARAYADNLTEEEILRAIRYAHLYGRKVYLTVNTLVKEKEFSLVRTCLTPFYEAGLDAVIIQDMGVFTAVGEWFPGLARHCSTQMTVTGAYGAAYLKKLGADRIVAARELSLEELTQIRKTVDVELEVFIHGAMCYSYSGQCLFSSLLGGRSGNRGRCAQPCRLPYSTQRPPSYKEAGYLLSLKDLCAISLLPKLLEAGTDSLKIEGRMKSPAYTAGVTAIYRKYMDQYYAHPQAPFCVEPEDEKQLRTLYIRSETGEGYLRRHNGSDRFPGREMLTPHTPGYSGTDEKLSEKIRRTYVTGEKRLPATGWIRLRAGEKALYRVSCGDITVQVQGDTVQAAQSRPLTGQEVVRQLSKSGNTFFDFTSIETDMDAAVFLPVKAINGLRRAACEKLEAALIKTLQSETAGQESRTDRNTGMQDAGNPESRNPQAPNLCLWRESGSGEEECRLHVSVLTKEQLYAALAARVERIYISAELMTGPKGTGREWRDLLSSQKGGPEIYPALPYALRWRDEGYLQQVRKLLDQEWTGGVLARNLEGLAWLKETGCQRPIVTDMGLYVWNSASARAFQRESGEQYLPVELNFHELRELLHCAGRQRFSLMVYGRLPMMVSAGCVARTVGACGTGGRSADKEKDRARDRARTQAQGGFLLLTDRRQSVFPVYTDCRHCYNVIYNSVPLSLHRQAQKVRELGPRALRLDFTVESGHDTQAILAYYREWMASPGLWEQKPPFKEYTGGHFKRGVE